MTDPPFCPRQRAIRKINIVYIIARRDKDTKKITFLLVCKKKNHLSIEMVLFVRKIKGQFQLRLAYTPQQFFSIKNNEIKKS